jgi:hypothetical protein
VIDPPCRSAGAGVGDPLQSTHMLRMLSPDLALLPPISGLAEQGSTPLPCDVEGISEPRPALAHGCWQASSSDQHPRGAPASSCRTSSAGCSSSETRIWPWLRLTECSEPFGEHTWVNPTTTRRHPPPPRTPETPPQPATGDLRKCNLGRGLPADPPEACARSFVARHEPSCWPSMV